MEVEIRNARPEEWEELAEIETAGFPPAEAASPEDIRRRMEVFPENFFVAVVDNRIVGFVNGGATDEPELPDEMYHDLSLHVPDGAYQTLFGLNVREEYRGKGIAQQLMGRFITESRKRGKKGLVLTCKEYMIPFYEKLEFKYQGIADSTHGGATWNLMILNLN